MAVSNLPKLAQRKLDGGDEALDVLRLADDELGAAQAELRVLARGLHPVALSERGLRSALESLTAGCEIRVTLDVDAQELPQQIELAAYFIVSESLTNANKTRMPTPSGSASRPLRKSSSSRSSMTARAAPTRHPGPACADSPTESRRSAADSR